MKLRIFILLTSVVIALFLFAACAPVKFLNTITPSGSYKLAKNVSYMDSETDGERQKLDIYQPKQPKANAPVVVFIYGGSWDTGNKNIYKFVGEAFAAQGYTTVIPNYRLYPEVKYPEFINDTAAAIAYTAKRYPEQGLIVIGHSAGAYNAMMVTVEPEYLRAQGLDVCQAIAGMVGLAGPYGAFPLKAEPFVTIFPDRHTADDAPVNLVNGPTPPLFMAIGDKDTTVSELHSLKLQEIIRARGGLASFKTYPGLNHTDVVKVLSRYFDDDSELKDDILNFIATNSEKRDNYCQ
ncbi:MAG: alpha/beta hydrolase [Robiginitomaculum sp.]|nr:alpha/beta hydrolase [Robiginitomaculum sp.]